MAYAFRRDNQGSPAFTGVYEGPDGRRRSAGTFSSKRAAQRAAHPEEQLVEEGRWRDRSLGHHLRDLRRNRLVPQQAHRGVDQGWLPLEPGPTLPALLRQLADEQDPARRRAGLGDQGGGGRSVTAVHPEVPHDAALDLRVSGSGSADPDQPVPAHRAPQDHRAAESHPDPGRVRTSGGGCARSARPAGDDGHRDGDALG